MRKNYVGYRIRLIHNQIHKIIDAKRRENEGELTGMQHWMMCFLMDHDGQDVYQRDIEAEFCISRATASNMLQVMERKGLLSRVAVDHDARLKKLLLTEPARAMIERANRDIREMEEQLIKDFSEDEVVQLRAYLDRIAENIGVEQAAAATKCGLGQVESTTRYSGGGNNRHR